jgi:glycosyltransferase involved in cell wall biosynthesis
MSTRVPLLSVVMPVFNGGVYLRHAIRSILQQTFHDFELIIVDDGSTDGTSEIIRSFADNRVHVVSQANSGPAHAFNRGLREARGEYVARMDSDDISLSSRFS